MSKDDTNGRLQKGSRHGSEKHQQHNETDGNEGPFLVEGKGGRKERCNNSNTAKAQTWGGAVVEVRVLRLINELTARWRKQQQEGRGGRPLRADVMATTHPPVSLLALGCFRDELLAHKLARQGRRQIWRIARGAGRFRWIVTSCPQFGVGAPSVCPKVGLPDQKELGAWGRGDLG